MATTCPKCNMRYDAERGFCPHDGTPLQPCRDAAPADTERLGSLQRTHEPEPDTAFDAANDHTDSQPAMREDKLVGSTLDGRYYIERKLGEGGMGVVFLARHVIIEKMFAIKVLKREVAREHSVVNRFVQEAKAASRIGHPAIVDVTDFGTTPDGLTYSVMEYVEGDTLGQIIHERAPMQLEQSVPIVVQIARALGAAHRKGIVHRDLKPENVFVLERQTQSIFVKIVDFGIAKVTPVEGATQRPRLTRAGTVFGTPEYMAPEQAAGLADTDQRVDIYALGIIFYELLVGHVPHKGDSLVRTLTMQMLDPIPPPRQTNPDADITDEIESVMMKALAKKRDHRFASMDELVAAIESSFGAVPLATDDHQSGAAVAVSAHSAGLPPLPPADDHRDERARFAVNDDKITVPDSSQPTAANRLAASRIDPAFVNTQPKFARLDEPGDNYSIGATNQADTTSTILWVKPRWPAALAIGLATATVSLLIWVGLRDSKSAVAIEPTLAAPAAIADAAAPEVEASIATEPTSFTDAAVELAEYSQPQPSKAQKTRRRSGHRKPRPRSSRWPAVTSPTTDSRQLPRLTTVTVLTRPVGATLYVDGSYGGTTGAAGILLRRETGSIIKLICKLPGHKDGVINIQFDGATEVYVCKLKRIKKCVRDLKNPFDDCPPEP